MNIGHSSNLIYDKCAYDDYLSESVLPGNYRLSPYSVHNCDGCLSTFGPRGSNGVSTSTDHVIAPKQKLTDIESILTNRNVPTSKCKDGKLNKVNVTKLDLKHSKLCGKTLDPLSTRLTHPAANYRGISINRFYDLNRNPQAIIHWNASANTRLEARDNYSVTIPKVNNMNNVIPK